MKIAIPGVTTALLVLFGSTILYTSIFSVNRSITSQVLKPLSAQHWYLSGPILPDHPMYVGLMARDRVVLSLTPAPEQPLRKLEYARKRYDSAVALLDKGEADLALSTLSKSQHYVLQAAQQAREQGWQQQSPNLFAQQVDESLYRLAVLLEEHPELRTNHLEALVASCQTELSLIPRVATGSDLNGLL